MCKIRVATLNSKLLAVIGVKANKIFRPWKTHVFSHIMDYIYITENLTIGTVINF